MREKANVSYVIINSYEEEQEGEVENICSFLFVTNITLTVSFHICPHIVI